MPPVAADTFINPDPASSSLPVPEPEFPEPTDSSVRFKAFLKTPLTVKLKVPWSALPKLFAGKLTTPPAKVSAVTPAATTPVTTVPDVTAPILILPELVAAVYNPLALTAAPKPAEAATAV